MHYSETPKPVPLLPCPPPIFSQPLAIAVTELLLIDEADISTCIAKADGSVTTQVACRPRAATGDVRAEMIQEG
jgi:hypothetical protein